MSATQPDFTEAQRLPTLLRSRGVECRTECEAIVVALYDAHRSRLISYVSAFGIARHDCEEVVQEVFLSLFDHLRKGKSDSNLRGWLFRVAHNLALKRCLVNRRWSARLEPNGGEMEDHRDPSPTPEEHVLSAHRQRRLRAVASALPEQDQWCLRLRAEGLRYREIAQVLGISLGAVSNSLARSMGRLMRADAMGR